MVRLPRTDASGAWRDDDEPLDDSELEPVAPARAKTRTQPNASQGGDARAERDATDAEQNTGSSSPSVPVMTGTHFHSLDEKGRIIVPAKLRPALTGQFWMMLDENDNIAIYNNQTGMDILSYLEQAMAEHPEDEGIAAVVQHTSETMDLVYVEDSWRVPIPEILRYRARLDKEIVTRGFLNRAVLMDRTKWEEEEASRMQSPELKKLQAKLLRAAASGAGKRTKAPSQAPEVHEENHAGRVATDTGTPTGTEAASTGDGRRNPRVLTLGSMGRGR